MDILLPLLYALGFGLLGYLCGSLPFAVWITRLFKGVDVRDAGSGHATTTNTIRQAGFGPGALVLALDIAKGFLPTWLALHVGRDTTSWYFGIPPYPWVAPLTAALVVVGHCWPLFAGFRGGMGNASTGGCLLAAAPIAFVIALGILVALTVRLSAHGEALILRHSARASLLMAPAFWLLGLGIPSSGSPLRRDSSWPDASPLTGTASTASCGWIENSPRIDRKYSFPNSWVIPPRGYTPSGGDIIPQCRIPHPSFSAPLFTVYYCP